MPMSTPSSTITPCRLTCQATHVCEAAGVAAAMSLLCQVSRCLVFDANAERIVSTSIVRLCATTRPEQDPQQAKLGPRGVSCVGGVAGTGTLAVKAVFSNRLASLPK
jgi:hypothetical protein